MKALLAIVLFVTGSSFAQAAIETREVSPAICQTRFADAQTAREVCATYGYSWLRWSSRPSAHDGGYICSCGTFDPSAPGTSYNSPF